MYKVGVIGNFDKTNAFDGQTIKTLEILNVITKKFGKKSVGQFSYHTFKKNPLKLFILLFSAIKNSEQLVLVFRGAAMKNLVKIILLINIFFKRPLHFVMVGSALYDVIKNKKSLINNAKKFTSIFAETKKISDDLNSLGINKTYILPNFKSIKLFTEDELNFDIKKPLKLVFFARVEPMKGIKEAVEVIKKINKESVIFTFDIYGRISEDFAKEFSELEKNFPSYIKYMGVADGKKSSEILNKYFLQIFPTRYKTEGFPASVLDSFFAGTPIIAARWNYYSEIISEGKNGLSYELDNFSELENILNKCAESPEIINNMRKNCLKEAEKYLPQNASKKLLEILEEN